MKMFDRSVCLKILSLYYIEQEHLRFPFSYIKMSPYILFKDSYILFDDLKILPLKH